VEVNIDIYADNSYVNNKYVSSTPQT